MPRKVIINPDPLVLKECEQLIENFPLFTLLDLQDIKKLAKMARILQVKEGSILVKEGSIVDSIHIIISGTAKVTRNYSVLGKTKQMNITLLEKGEGIGLGRMGFFSASGIRNATVTAITDMLLLSFDLHYLHQFLVQTNNLPSMAETLDKILLMNFIQDTNLFIHLPKEKIRALADHIKKIKIEKGEILFKEGDVAKECYYILQGTIEIFAQDKNKHKEKSVCKIGEASLIGEGAFINGTKRSASARAIKPCELYVLDEQDLRNIQIDNDMLNTINVLRIEQIRPQKKPTILEEAIKNVEGDEVYFLSKINHKDKLQISKQNYAIWKSIDGNRTIDDIRQKIAAEIGDLSIQDIYQRIYNLAYADYVELDNVTFKKRETKTTHQQLIDKIQNKILKKNAKH